MPSYNIHDAKTHFSQLLQLAEAGQEVIIARNGVPAARLVTIKDEDSGPRKPGGWEGKVWKAADYDAADAEVAALMVGEEEDSWHGASWVAESGPAEDDPS